MPSHALPSGAQLFGMPGRYLHPAPHMLLRCKQAASARLSSETPTGTDFPKRIEEIDRERGNAVAMPKVTASSAS